MIRITVKLLTLVLVTLTFGLITANAHSGRHDCHHATGARTTPHHRMNIGERPATQARFVRIAKNLGTAATAPTAPSPQVREDGGCTCLRGECTCTPNTHGRSHCYRTRGDCPTHPGILCVWNMP